MKLKQRRLPFGFPLSDVDLARVRANGGRSRMLYLTGEEHQRVGTLGTQEIGTSGIMTTETRSRVTISVFDPLPTVC